MLDPRLHFAVIVHPAKVLGTILVGLAVLAMVGFIVAVLVYMWLAELALALLHLIVTMPLLFAGVLLGGVLVVAAGIWLGRAAYRLLMA